MTPQATIEAVERPINVAIGCEFSGTVRDAFISRGHNAVSYDLIDTEKPGPHVVGNLLEQDLSWADLLIVHPPCTYLCSMGIWWNHKRPERWALTEAAAAFFMACWNLRVPRLALENPVGTMSTRFRKPNQIVNPWQFGDEATKPTCLWTRGLPDLVPTQIVGKGKFYVKANGSRMSAWSHKCSGTRKEERARIASRTFPGIARAMAEQWGGAVTERRTA